MKWILNFDLFLFDFDGLLVDTERLHYKAYMEMLAQRGQASRWDFERFCSFAHLNATALRDAIYAAHPGLDEDWARLYAQKQENYARLIAEGQAALMPGAGELIERLASEKKRCCVVTNSSKRQTQMLASFLPVLKNIPYWVVREDYERPKPDPQCYLRAIELYAKPADRIVGFEDSLRGWEALRKAGALPVCVSRDVKTRDACAGIGLQMASLEGIFDLHEEKPLGGSAPASSSAIFPG